MDEFHTVIFSDVHLGSPVSRAYDLLQTLKAYRFKKLIIAGDMFEDLNFKYLTSTHWELLQHIGKVSRRGVEAVWIKGNHDAKFLNFMSGMIGIPVVNEHVWEVNNKRFLAMHGHQFDSFLTKNTFWGRVLAGAYSFFQRRVSSHFFDLILVKISDRWERLTEQVADGAIKYAKNRKCDVVVCGHTHFVCNLKKDGVEYFNLGSWTNRPSYLFAVKNDGSADLKVIT